MTKQCLGCGITLQSISPYTLGYTPSIDNHYCERCFKITHYNANIDAELKTTNQELLGKINEKKAFVIFLVDYLNIYEEVINTYKNITRPKMLIITKSDIIPKNVKYQTLIKNFQKIYDIDDKIMLCNIQDRTNMNSLLNTIKLKKNVLFAGFTNSGKSSLINNLIGANITVSQNSNTTLDFIELKFAEFTIYDAPGFIPSAFIDSMTPKSHIKPKTYQLQSKYYLKFLNMELSTNVDNNITLHINNLVNIEKRKLINIPNYNIKVPDNHDRIIKGLGYINIKKKCLVSLNIDPNLLEIRPSLVGEHHG